MSKTIAIILLMYCYCIAGSFFLGVSVVGARGSARVKAHLGACGVYCLDQDFQDSRIFGSDLNCDVWDL